MRFELGRPALACASDPLRWWRAEAPAPWSRLPIARQAFTMAHDLVDRRARCVGRPGRDRREPVLCGGLALPVRAQRRGRIVDAGPGKSAVRPARPDAAR